MRVLTKNACCAATVVVTILLDSSVNVAPAFSQNCRRVESLEEYATTGYYGTDRLGEIIDVYQGYEHFRIPRGYLNGPRRANPPSDFYELDQSGQPLGGADLFFAFWMPTGRYVQGSVGRTVGDQQQPCEPGMPPPSDDESVVRATIELPFTGPRSMLFSDPMLLPSSAYYSTVGSLVPSDPTWEYFYFEREDPEIVLPNVDRFSPNFEEYIPDQIDGLPNQVYMRCRTNRPEGFYVFCMGRAYWRENPLIIEVHFPRQFLYDWPMIFETARQLTLSWHQPVGD